MEKIKQTQAEYVEGIHYLILGWIYPRILEGLEKEKRFYGRAKSYMNNINDVIQECDTTFGRPEMNSYMSILGDLRNQIYFDYSRLSSYRLSGTDRLIIISLRLLDIVSNTESASRWERQIKTYEKVMTRMYENIRNTKKYNDFNLLESLVLRMMNRGEQGEVLLDTFEPVNQDPRDKELILDSGKTLLEEEKTNYYKEILS